MVSVLQFQGSGDTIQIQWDLFGISKNAITVVSKKCCYHYIILYAMYSHYCSLYYISGLVCNMKTDFGYLFVGWILIQYVTLMLTS